MAKKIAFSILSVVIIFFISLPVTRYRLKENIKPVSIPGSLSEIDSYITQSEGKFSDIIPGAEKKIIWASHKKEQTEFALVYIHGFGACRQEIAPVPDLVAKDLKINLFYTRLSGHGRTAEAFANSTENEWLNDAVEAFETGKKLGRKVILMGTSTGATIVLWLANRGEYRKDTAALVLISPNIHVANKSINLFLYPAGVGFVKMVYGKERSWEPQNADQAMFWNHKYPWEALTPMIVLVDYMKDIPYEKIDTPALFLYTENDKTIDLKELVKKFDHYGSKEKKLLNLKQCMDHVMAGDIVTPECTPAVNAEITGFLKSVIKK